MTSSAAALPMYDWPERRAAVDAQWASLRDRLRGMGVDAPDTLARRNADLPPVPGGIRDTAGRVIAPDPATLPPDEFDLPTLWRHPALLFAQTCWGPLQATGLAAHVVVVGQPDYSGVEGGEGELYSSAIVMRRAEFGGQDVACPSGGSAQLPLDLMRGRRLAYNDPHSRSGLLALAADLEAAGEGIDIFSDRVETGGHRLSIRAVASGRADLAAIDCLTWRLARQYEPSAADLAVIGWTGRRKGLPFIASRSLAHEVLHAVIETLGQRGED